MQFEELAKRALDTAAARGAEYADIRFESARSERIEVRNGVVATLADATQPRLRHPRARRRRLGIRRRSRPERRGYRSRRGARGRRSRKASASIARSRIGQAPQRAYVDTFRNADAARSARRSARRTRRAAARSRKKAARLAAEIAVGRAWMDLVAYRQVLLQHHRFAQSSSASGKPAAACEALAVGDGDVQTRTFPGDIGLYQVGRLGDRRSSARSRERAAHRRRSRRAADARRNARAARSTSF